MLHPFIHPGGIGGRRRKNRAGESQTKTLASTSRETTRSTNCRREGEREGGREGKLQEVEGERRVKTPYQPPPNAIPHL